MSHLFLRRPRRLARPATLLALVGLGMSGCAAKIDKITVNRIVARALTMPDVDQSCEIGVSLRSPLAGATKESKPARKSLLIAEATAAMCDEVAAWSHELDRAKALSDALGHDPAQRARLARDAGFAADRYHQRAAARYQRSWQQAVAEFGPIGEQVCTDGADGKQACVVSCPKLKPHEEFPYFIALVAGIQSVLHDTQSGRTLEIPKETILSAARGAECIQSDSDGDGAMDGGKWWYAPEAIQAAAWATIPGSGPADADPWAIMEEMGQKGDALGVRVARGLQVTIAMNAGKEDVARAAIRSHAAALDAHPQSTSHALLDRYAYLLSLHQSDLLWIAEEGYRTPVFGELPGTPADAPDGDDPFGGDPFGEDAGGDPFASDPPTAEPPAEPTEDSTDTPAQEPR